MASEYHSTRFVLDKKRILVWKVFTPYLQKRFTMGNKVLDLGCGYGEFINHIQGVNRFAVDAAIEVKAALDPSVQFKQASLPTNLMLFGEKMSTVFASNLLEHLDRGEIDSLLFSIFDVLEPGGLFLSLTPNFKRAAASYYDDFTHKTPLTEVSLSDWLKAKGFEIEFCHAGFMPFSVKDSKLPVKEFLIRSWLRSPWKPWGKQMLIAARKPR